jgi:hypothetical protein
MLLYSGLVARSTTRSLWPTGRAGGACGILLAGRSGVGKSTAVQRLLHPWQALADDVTLVVRHE